MIKGALQSAVNGVNTSKSVIQILATITALIPGVDLFVGLFAAAAYGLVTAIATGTIGDYEAGLADSTLWSNITCAIFTAIADDGAVTAANCAAVQAAIAGVSYTHPDVMTVINAYVAAIGCNGLMQAQQAGVLNTYDCSACGHWCHEWDFTVSDGGWSALIAQTSYVGGSGWHGHYNAAHGHTELELSIRGLPAYTTNEAVIGVIAPAGSITGFDVLEYYLGSAQVNDTGFGATPSGTLQRYDVPGASVSGDGLNIIWLANGNAGDIVVAYVQLRGIGVNPFGASDCTH